MENNFNYIFAWGFFSFALGLGIGLIGGMICIYKLILRTMDQVQKEYINAFHKI